jgi:hypothetical protein
MTDQKSMDQIRLARITSAARLMLRFTAEQAHSEVNIYSIALARDLREEERIMLIKLLVNSMPADLAEDAMAAIFEDNGWPTSGLFDDVKADAKMWTNDASGREIKAYAGACVRKMSEKSRREFLEWAQSL